MDFDTGPAEALGGKEVEDRYPGVKGFYGIAREGNRRTAGCGNRRIWEANFWPGFGKASDHPFTLVGRELAG